MDIVFISLATFVASGVGTVSGFGTSTMLVPFLLLFYPFSEVLLLAGIIHLVGNIWRVLFFRKGIRISLMLFFGIFGAIASYIGSQLAFTVPSKWLYIILGLFFSIYAIFLFVFSRFKIEANALNSSIGGVVSGFISGLFGVGGPVRAMFLSAFHLEKTVYLATVGTIGLFIDTVRVWGYFVGGSQLSTRLWLGLIVCIPCSFFGANIAKKIVHKIPQKKFRLVIVSFLLVAGLYMINLAL